MGEEQRGEEDSPAGAVITEARYRSVVEGSLQGIIIQQDGRIVYANPAMARLFGFSSPGELLGLDPFTDLIADDDLQTFRERTAAAYRGDHLPPHSGWRARHRAGELVWLSSSAYISEWEGRPAVTSFYFDITERKLAELALEESQARYRTALKAGRMGSWETDLVAGRRYWTEEGMALFGLSLPGGLGTVGGASDEYLAAIHPDDRHLVAGIYATADRSDDFMVEYRVVRPGGAIVWLSGRGQVIRRRPDGRAARLVSIMADITERKQAELHVRFLLWEMTHRSKNLLAVIQSISRQTSYNAAGVDDFHERFASRLRGLAAMHDVLVRSNWRGAALKDLITQQLAPLVDLPQAHVTIEGPPVTVTADSAQTLGLAVHELATNAIKHGALSVSSGEVAVTWTSGAAAGPAVQLTWLERGGPPVLPPARKGFGHVLMTDMVTAGIDARVDLVFHHEGIVWSAGIPSTALIPEGTG